MTQRDLPRGIYRRGRIYWICYAISPNKMKHESTGSTRLAHAKALKATREDEVFTARKYPELVRSMRTVGAIVEHYRRHIRSKATVHQIGPRLDAAVAFLGAETEVGEVSFDRLDAWAENLADARKLQPQSVRLYLGALRAAFRYARRSRFCDVNPMTDYEVPKGKKKRRRVASSDEVRQIIEFLSEHRTKAYREDLRRAVVLGVETGMRRAEVSQLRWSWIDLRNHVIRIPREVTKTEEARSVPITEAVMEVLSEKPKDPIIKLDPEQITDKFSRAMRKLGIVDLHFHDLRHTRATTWIKAGVPEAVVQAILGHESVAMTRHYTNLTEQDLREAIARLRPSS